MINYHNSKKQLVYQLYQSEIVYLLNFSINMMSLHDKLLQAKKRQQPYVNLTNQKYLLTDIFDEQNIETYKKINLKSLYFRTNTIEFNEIFGRQINKLITAGIREIFIFCDQESSKLTQISFLNFLKEHNIRINVRIAQLSETDINNIQSDAIGKNDTLGFDKIDDYHLVYSNGWQVKLLNSRDSDQVILGNYQSYKQKISENFLLEVKEPEYIKTTLNPEIRISKAARMKAKIDLESQLQLEITHNLDVNLAVNQEMNQENELDIDQDQLANKFGRYEAHKYVEKKQKSQFKEEFLLVAPGRYMYEANIYKYNQAIFASGTQIQYITQAALDLMIPHWPLFSSGIDMHNLPIGLAFKDGVIFASEKRPSSMPINDLTLQLDYISPTISDPIKYSWLYFATKSSISLNDMYGSKDAIKITGNEEHPGVKNSSGDIMLDIPYNHNCLRYKLNSVDHDLDCKSEYQYRPGLSYDKTGAEYLDSAFPMVQFYNLSSKDKERLKEIWHQLIEREIAQIFNQFLLKLGVNDGGFLLEEKASVFLKKLFQEILPIPSDQDKSRFFKEVLSIFSQSLGQDEGKPKRFILEDVFEGINASFNKFQHFLLAEDIKNEEQKIELNNKFLAILKNQLGGTTSFKITAGRVISILELNSKNGGSLSEQIEYLNIADGENLAATPELFTTAELFEQNVLHNALSIKSVANIPVQVSSLIKVDSTIPPDEGLSVALQHLASVAPHQRASIDTYTKYFKQHNNHDSSFITGSPLSRDCDNMDFEALQDLATIEYIQSELLKFHIEIYPIPENFNPEKTMFAIYWTTTDELPNDLSNNYVLYKVINNRDLRTILHYKEQDIEIKYYDTVINGSDQVISYIITQLQKKLGQDYGKFSAEDNKYIDSLLELSEEGLEGVVEEIENTNKLLLADFEDNEICIGFDGEQYAIFRWLNDTVIKLDEAELILPTTLDTRIKEWHKNGQKNNFITFSYEEMSGTTFACQINRAMSNAYQFLKKQAAGNLHKLEEMLNQAEKNSVPDQRYAPLGIVAEDANLVHHFTTNQVSENLRLLTLNIISSSGHHYDPQYPDQEFQSYTSLFSLLFEEVKIKEPVKAGESRLVAKKDYNRDDVFIETKFLQYPKNSEVKDKEEQHKKIVNNFLRVYQENPEFKFGEVALLGLVANFKDQADTDKIIKQAKELHQYKGYFYQLLRVLIATSTNTGLTGLSELKARTDNIARIITFLTDKFELTDNSPKIHEFLIGNNSPENLILFASFFARQSEIKIDDLREFLSEITQLSASVKQQLLHSLVSTKLPFANNTIVEDSYFPIFNLKALSNLEELQAIVEQASNEHVSYTSATRFNEVTRSKMQSSKPDFSIIESKYGITFRDSLKLLNFLELKQAIIKDPNFIKNNQLGFIPNDKQYSEMIFDFVVEMFAVIVLHETGWETLHHKAMKLLFNPEKTLSEQLNQIDYNKAFLDDLLVRCKSQYDKDNLIDLLLQGPSIPYDQQQTVITYLRSIPTEKLQDLGHNLPSFLSIVPKHIYVNNLPLFKVATDFLLNNNIALTLQEFYNLIDKVSDIKDSIRLFSHILKYCHENKEFSLLDFVAQLNSKSKNFGKIIEWLTTIKTEFIKQMIDNPNLELKSLFRVYDIEKIKIVAQIALNLDIKLSKDQYDKIIKYVAKHSLDDVKLLKSYILAPSTSTFTESAKMNLVINSLTNLHKAQVLFAEANLDRFDYNLERLNKKIASIAHKTHSGFDGESRLSSNEQNEIKARFITIMERSKEYKNDNYNELQDKSLELKHEYILHKDESRDFILNLVLEFIALNIEVMYRQTGKFPRDTQILTILNTLIHDQHLIAEVATGQGKSIIATLHASYLWFTGQTVDVVTSSRTLAERDLQEFSSYYDALGIQCGNNIITPQSSIEDYKKSGINYGLASDLALFRADREFHSNKHDDALNTDVSIVCDEIDATLTSDVNFKLAIPLVNLNHEETRILFGLVLDFSDLTAFNNLNISRKDDIKNLELFLNYQFEKYDSSLHFPLNVVQLDKLKKSNHPTAKTLYTLNQALSKCIKDKDKLFDKLLDSVSMAKNLENGVHYVIMPLNNEEGQSLKAVPIVKDQPSKDTVFGDGVQALLHLLLERKNQEWQMKFEISPPSATIFNISPKNFFDYYRLTHGRIVGLTGTAGSKVELDEFATTNKIVAFTLPKFEDEHKVIIPDIEVINLNDQYSKTVEVLKGINSDRPVLVFCESSKHAEEVYKLIKPQYDNVQLCASSQLDTSSVPNVVQQAGHFGTITVTTPMLGRGIDFLTKHHEGYFAINLCTDITYSSLWQIYGRIGRNGDNGTVVSIFNRDLFANNIETPTEHMEYVSNEEKITRMRTQPLTEILKYFGKVNHDNTLNAILSNEFITKSWNKLLTSNDKMPLSDKKSMLELRTNLVKVVQEQYPEASKNLEAYLQQVDSNRFVEVELYSADYVIQPDQMKPAFAFTALDFTYNSNIYWRTVEKLAISTPIFKVEKPAVGTEYNTFYQNYLQVNNAKMFTHAFAIEENIFEFVNYFTVRFAHNIPPATALRYDEIILSVSYGDRIIAHLKDKPYESIRLSNKDEVKYGISLELENKIKSYQNSEAFIPLTKNEIQEIRDYLFNKNHVNYKQYSKGEGSLGSLMLDEFKQSFADYQTFVNSVEVNKIKHLIDNFRDIQDIDFSNLQPGKYQAINIETKFTSSSSHAESIVTDGKFLFWINRGGGANQGAGIGDGSGIKIFKITKGLGQVKLVLNGLKIIKSQTETRKDIFSLLREDIDDKVPPFVLVEMGQQTIGNCGWVQTKSVLYALGIIGRIHDMDMLPDVESQEWQKILKDSYDIYKDFSIFDRISRVEALLYSIDTEYQFKFLDIKHQQEIIERYSLVKEPATQQLLERLTENLEENADKYKDTIYGHQYHIIFEKLQLETTLGSAIGQSLEALTDRETAKYFLKSYQSNYLGDFKDLHKLYNNIKNSRLEEKVEQNKLFMGVLQFIIQKSIVLHDITEFTDRLTKATKDCVDMNTLNEDCIISGFTINDNSYIEMEDQCIDRDYSFLDNIFSTSICFA